MTLDSILSRVALSVPGCPHPVMAMAIYDAAKMFCERTRVLTLAFTLPVVAGMDEYDIGNETTSEIIDFDSVSLDGVRLEATPRAGDFDATDTCWYALVDGVLKLVATPSKAAQLNGVAVLASKNSGALPDKLSRWQEGIAAGALYRLLGTHGQAWSDAQAAANQWQIHEEEIRKAITASTLPTGKRALRVRPDF